MRGDLALGSLLQYQSIKCSKTDLVHALESLSDTKRHLEFTHLLPDPAYQVYSPFPSSSN